MRTGLNGSLIKYDKRKQTVQNFMNKLYAKVASYGYTRTVVAFQVFKSNQDGGDASWKNAMDNCVSTPLEFEWVFT